MKQAIQKLLRAALARAPMLWPLLMHVAALAALAAGAWMIYPPAGLIVPGALLWIESVFGGSNEKSAEKHIRG